MYFARNKYIYWDFCPQVYYLRAQSGDIYPFVGKSMIISGVFPVLFGR